MFRSATVLLVILALIWGVNWPIMKVAVQGMEPWTFRAYCTTFGGFGMLLVARLGGHSLRMATDQWGAAIAIAPFNLAGWLMLSALGVALMGSGRAAIIAYTMPLWAMLFARLLLNEALSRRRLVGVTLGLAGLAILLGHDFSLIEDSPLGAVFMLGAAVVWAFGNVLFKRKPWHTPLTVVMGWQLLAISPPLILMALLTETVLPAAGPWTWLAVLYNVAISTVIGFYVWNRIVLLLPAGAAAIGSLAVPVVGVLSGGLMLGESVGWRELVALALIITAIAVVMLDKSSAGRTLQRP